MSRNKGFQVIEKVEGGSYPVSNRIVVCPLMAESGHSYYHCSPDLNVRYYPEADIAMSHNLRLALDKLRRPFLC